MIAESESQDKSEHQDSILESDLRWQLATRIARTPTMSRAVQLQNMLLFIVRMAILKPEVPISESDIAYRALGRQSDFNPMEDTIVRVQMAHLRKKLDHYFSTDGKDEGIVITVALGNYKPVFSNRSKIDLIPEADAAQRETHTGFNEELSVADAPKPPYIVPKNFQLHADRPRWMIMGLIATALIALAFAGAYVTLWVQDRDRQRTLTQWRNEPTVAAFWSSFLDSNRATDIVMGDHSLLLIEEVTGKQATLNDYVHRSFLVPAQDQVTEQDRRKILAIIGTKNLRSMNEVTLVRQFLTLDPLGKKVRLYGPREFTADLVGHDNLIFIGNRATNPWQELFDQQLNFSMNTELAGIEGDFKDRNFVINRSPNAGEQQSYTSNLDLGFCVLTYRPNPGHDGKVLLIEGSNTEATEAGGEFLLSEDQMSRLQKLMNTASGFPYFQVVLKINQLRDFPIAATIEAYRVYPKLH